MRKFAKKNAVAYTRNSQRKIDLDKALIKFVVRDLQPLCVVEDEGFVGLIKALDPRYALPSRRNFRDAMLQKVFEKTTANVADILKSVQ